MCVQIPQGLTSGILSQRTFIPGDWKFQTPAGMMGSGITMATPLSMHMKALLESFDGKRKAP